MVYLVVREILTAHSQLHVVHVQKFVDGRVNFVMEDLDLMEEKN